MSEYLFKERRSVPDRRTGRDRRIFSNPAYAGAERRSCMDRRGGEERRKWFRLFLKLGCRPLYPGAVHNRVRRGSVLQ